MKTLLNLLWFFLCGIWLFFGYALAALAFAITVIGIPFAVASWRIGVFALWPFGKVIVPKNGNVSGGSMVLNIIWILFCGWLLALGNVISGIILCCTVIGIPLGLGCFKLVPVSLLPFGYVAVDEASLQYVPANAIRIG